MPDERLDLWIVSDFSPEGFNPSQGVKIVLQVVSEILAEIFDGVFLCFFFFYQSLQRIEIVVVQQFVNINVLADINRAAF